MTRQERNNQAVKAYLKGKDTFTLGGTTYTVPTPQSGGSDGQNAKYNGQTLAALKRGSVTCIRNGKQVFLQPKK